MRLSDIVGHWDLATYPLVALVIFLLVFVGVLVRLYVARAGRGLERFAHLPIEEDAPSPRRRD